MGKTESWQDRIIETALRMGHRVYEAFDGEPVIGGVPGAGTRLLMPTKPCGETTRERPSDRIIQTERLMGRRAVCGN